MEVPSQRVMLGRGVPIKPVIVATSMQGSSMLVAVNALLLERAKVT
ncbi:MAG TPA: hypothetical protein VFM85_09110 [Actinomycetota bacterium]|nr:hypothetical protein [Actinomycetota bacterium]